MFEFNIPRRISKEDMFADLPRLIWKDKSKLEKIKKSKKEKEKRIKDLNKDLTDLMSAAGSVNTVKRCLNILLEEFEDHPSSRDEYLDTMIISNITDIASEKIAKFSRNTKYKSKKPLIKYESHTVDNCLDYIRMCIKTKTQRDMLEYLQISHEIAYEMMENIMYS